MKKFTIAAVLALATLAASATDVSVRTTRNTNTDSNATGVTIGQDFGKFGGEVAFDRTLGGNANDRYSLVGTYKVAKLGAAVVNAKLGGAYVNPKLGADGYAALVGVGVSYPLFKGVSLTGDYAYQVGQERVNAFDGNTYTLGVKYSF